MIFEPGDVWFTSDTHFWHENIIRFCKRPFGSISEMNDELVRRWNETVPPDGIVFHLGDFAFGGPKQWNDVLSRLNGHIYLILGNHDMKQVRQGFMGRFVHVTQQMTIRVGGQPIVLNHNPFLCYGGSYRNVWQLFGHVHSGPLSDQGKDIGRLSVLFPRQYDVGVDNNDFRPVSFNEIKAIIEGQVKIHHPSP
ncbi:MAG: metallophosphoesterase [Bacteroidales bacterium]|nr:metallophosphoesterase [Bacteroidales bacterium]MBQ9711433.1 metallophosphoesterase [Bacteroidales bacterium]